MGCVKSWLVKEFSVTLSTRVTVLWVRHNSMDWREETFKTEIEC